MSAYRPLNEAAIEAYDIQRVGGVAAETTPADVISGFTAAEEAHGLLEELQGVVGSGQSVDIELLTGAQVRVREPRLSPEVRFGVLLRDQRYLDPAAYVAALAESVRARGGKIIEQTPVIPVARRGTAVVARTADGDIDADAVVLANGAWLSTLAAPTGSRLRCMQGAATVSPFPPPNRCVSPSTSPPPELLSRPQGTACAWSGLWSSPTLMPPWPRPGFSR